MVRLTDRPDMTLDVYRGRKTSIQRRPGRPQRHLIRDNETAVLTISLYFFTFVIIQLYT